MLPFHPTLSYSELEAMLGTWHDFFDGRQREVCSDAVYDSVARLTGYAHPKLGEDDWAAGRWNFYLPVRRRGKRIAVPVSVIAQSRPEPAFFLGTARTSVTVKKGSEEAPQYEALIADAEKLVPLLKAAPEIVFSTVPYDIRTGKIKRKWAVQEEEQGRPYLAAEEAARIREAYAAHKKKEQTQSAPHTVSLNEYLSVAARCYRAAFREKAVGTPRELYAKFADGRHGGMLNIDEESPEAFAQWLESDQWMGNHPFEIKYSSHHHGICLYPPAERFETDRYRLDITDLSYATEFVEMVQELMRSEIPFTTRNLQRVLDFQTGDSLMRVNQEAEHQFWYTPSRENRKKYFQHIVWDELKVPEWKER